MWNMNTKQIVTTILVPADHSEYIKKHFDLASFFTSGQNLHRRLLRLLLEKCLGNLSLVGIKRADSVAV